MDESIGYKRKTVRNVVNPLATNERQLQNLSLKVDDKYVAIGYKRIKTAATNVYIQCRILLATKERRLKLKVLNLLLVG